MTVKINTANIIALLHALAGAALVILPLVGVTDASTTVNAVTTAIGGVLLAVSAWHAGSVVAARAKAKPA